MTWEINAVQGGTITRRLTLTNPDGSPYLTEGWVWRCGISSSRAKVPVAVEEVDNGVIEFTIPAAQSRSLEPGVYTLAVDWTDALGNTPEDEIRGILRIERDAAL